jgi:bifunctional UDP-N-acetylglucosamine pyrophosphorylase/glucosamine-1-phosphate N-acetyltransferase
VVVNGDDLIDPQIFKAFKNQINQDPGKMAVTGWKIDHFLSGGYLSLDGNLVTGVVEKPKEGKQPSDYLNLVLHYFPDGAAWIKTLSITKSDKDDVYEKALNQAVKKEPAQLVEGKGYFKPLKYAHHLLDLTKLILSKRLNQEKLIDKSAKIMEGAVVKNSYIGPNVIIGNNCLVRDSIIEAGSVVGFGSEIARSYVGPKSWFHCNYVGDSVVEGSSNMGSGARLANWRFDGKPVRLKISGEILTTNRVKLGAIIGKGAKIGINASIMPGITIGENSIVGSGVVLNESVLAKEKHS